MNKFFIATAISTIVASSCAQAETTFEKIARTKVITEGVRESSGLAYTLGNGVYTGFHFDVCAGIIADIRKRLKSEDIETRYQPVTSQNRVALVQNGTVDIECGSTTNNEARAKDVDFAVTTFVEEVKIATRADSGIKGLADLNGKNVVTTTGSTSVQTLRRNQRAHDISFNEIYGKDHADSFLLLQSGRADAFVMDSSILAANIAKSSQPKDFVILDEVLSVEPIALMLKKGDEEFRNAVDDSIKAQMANGTLSALYKKWFLEPIPPAGVVLNLPLSEQTRAAWENPNSKPAEAYRAQ